MRLGLAFVPSRIARGAVLAAALAAAYGLLATGASTLTAWTERFVPRSRYPALLGGYVATWLLVRAATRRCRT